LYPLTEEPVVTTGADHFSVILLDVWWLLCRPVATPGAVDTSVATPTSPSPAPLKALTTYVYRRPLSSPVTPADDDAPSYTSAPNDADGTATPVTSYTRYPVAAKPVLNDGADQESWNDDAVWLSLSSPDAGFDAVDCESTSLRSPSPDALTALTANLYDTPPASPVTSTDDVKAPRYASVDTAADSPAPSSMYSTYSVTVSPPFSTGAVHSNVMLLVVCNILDSAVGAPGAVDCVKAVLTSPSPATLTALTTNEYNRLPSSPDTTPLVVVDPEPS